MYKKVGCTAGFEAAGGGFAQYVRVMDWIVRGGLVKIPDDVAFEQAAWVEPVNTCLKGIKSLKLEADDTVLVIGQGPIGIVLGALAGMSGARVLGSDLYAQRLGMSAEFGIGETIDASREDVVARVREQTEGRGADAVILAVAGDRLIRTAMDACRPGGRVMLFAATQHGEAAIDPAAVCMEEKSLLGSYSASVEIQEETAELVFSGRFDFTRLISHRFGLADAVEAIDLASHPRPDSLKVMIQP